MNITSHSLVSLVVLYIVLLAESWSHSSVELGHSVKREHNSSTSRSGRVLVRTKRSKGSAYIFSKPCQSDLECEDQVAQGLSSSNVLDSCDLNIQRCHCPQGSSSTLASSVGVFYNSHGATSSHAANPLTSSSSSCLKVATLGHLCTFQEQCIVQASFCPQRNSRLYSKTDNKCVCSKGYVARGRSPNIL
ncbi:hypothetical protein HDE_13247 [Halotydeus destructor]|nr:hypothetical protein HDE_13247 [Halotydeus destructor]